MVAGAEESPEEGQWCGIEALPVSVASPEDAVMDSFVGGVSLGKGRTREEVYQGVDTK